MKRPMLRWGPVMWAMLLFATTPFEVEAQSEEARATVVFTGDVGLAWHKKKSNDRNNAWQRTRLSGIAPLLEGADLTLSNMEGVMSRRRPKCVDRTRDMWVDAATAPIFASAGIDLVSLANNHAYDAGCTGVMETVEALRATGVTVFGGGEDEQAARAPYVTEFGGQCVAFVPATLSSNQPVSGSGPGRVALYPRRDRSAQRELLELVENASRECGFVAVYIHWARSNHHLPSRYARKLARRLVASGADLIVGHHPHVLQGVEFVGATPVVYSLGNTVFANSERRTRKTGLLRVELKIGAEVTVDRVELLPVMISGGDFTPHPATERQTRRIHALMRRISASFPTRVELRDGRLRFSPSL